MTVQSSAGAKLYIADPGPLSPTPTWVEVGEITNFGEFGRRYELITHKPVATRGTRKLKGTYDDGALSLELGRDPGDAGQAKLITARDSDDLYLFKIELDDLPSGGGDPTTFTFEALVMSYTTNIGSADQIIGATVDVQIESGSITETAAH